MAAFTTFTQSALCRYLAIYDLGELKTYSPITAGIENSNYYVTLTRDGVDCDYVLTINESLNFEQAPFFSQLLDQLARQNLPVPAPHRTMDGMSSTVFCGKPTWLFPCLPGVHPDPVSTEQCRAIGASIAKLHTAAQGPKLQRTNPYSATWLETTYSENRWRLEEQDQASLDKVAAEYRQLQDLILPVGIIHGDLFRDNALFIDDELTGIIDFYHACTDFLIQDLAITINDWCSDENGVMRVSLCDALIGGYEAIRPLEADEHKYLPAFQRVGAMRFLLTRYVSDTGDGPLKDPMEFIRIGRHLSLLAF
ncbi:MAG: homoserine kinase type II [Candidatus Azotimanducaceae bacterium]|jgi:homoserine kinase type II